MPTFRKVVLANDQFYHIYNRGVEKRSVFETKWEYQRSLDTLKYYRFADLPFRLSQLLKIARVEREQILSKLQGNDKLVEIIAFCLMPNHFHFLLKQLQDGGIKKFISNFTNSYTKYFNTKHERIGPLFEGIFKAVLVQSDEQLVHLSRYIHLNPSSSFVVPIKGLEQYPWSSFREYLGLSNESFCDKKIITDLFFKGKQPHSIKAYHKFVLDQAAYAQELDKIKHLIME